MMLLFLVAGVEPLEHYLQVCKMKPQLVKGSLSNNGFADEVHQVVYALAVYA